MDVLRMRSLGKTNHAAKAHVAVNFSTTLEIFLVCLASGDHQHGLGSFRTDHGDVDGSPHAAFILLILRRRRGGSTISRNIHRQQERVLLLFDVESWRRLCFRLLPQSPERIRRTSWDERLTLVVVIAALHLLLLLLRHLMLLRSSLDLFFRAQGTKHILEESIEVIGTPEHRTPHFSAPDHDRVERTAKRRHTHHGTTTQTLLLLCSRLERRQIFIRRRTHDHASIAPHESIPTTNTTTVVERHVPHA
mmetsp:Transcript_7716/g.17593  ORF Transcript_7716/g.17593 Transcript_7716/m.17593 type:complete len:249 (+) Transcript_7716:1519-2265(+)